MTLSCKDIDLEIRVCDKDSIPLKAVTVDISCTQRNWVFATNSHFLTPISLQSDSVNLWYFKLRLFELIELIVWNIKGPEKRVVKL